MNKKKNGKVWLLAFRVKFDFNMTVICAKYSTLTWDEVVLYTRRLI